MLLSESAEPGQILISRATRELTAAAIDVEHVGRDRFLLRSAHATRPLAVCLDTPLAGRDEEMSLLEAACARAIGERAATLVTVLGEAGIGKTRLVHEVAGRLRGAVTMLTGHCLPYGEGITFWPLREIVRQAAGGQDSSAAIQALLHGAADAAEAVAVADVADVADTVAVAERLSTALGTSDHGGSDLAEIFWATRRLLETLARSRPLIVVFEDLHWAEPAFLDLVESLAVQQARSPVIWMCVARPELMDMRPAWAAGAASAISVKLAPLAPGPAAALLDALAVSQEMPALTRARLLETAAGNPLYLEQLAASLTERAGYETRPSLPPTIEALLATRLQRLEPGPSMVLARAAIAGNDFEVPAVRELLPSEARGSLGGHLRTLVAKGLIQHVPSAAEAAREFCFHHILIQQAAYRAIPKALRGELHHRFADWLEQTASGQTASDEMASGETASGHTARHAEIIGHHLEQAARYLRELRPDEAQSSQLPRRAAAHLETAGHAAHNRGDALAAVNLLDRAVSLLEHAGPLLASKDHAEALPAGQDPALARLYTSLGTALTEAGQLGKARAAFAAARRAAAIHGDEAQGAHAWVQALLLNLRMDPDRAAADITRALPELRREFGRTGDQLGLCWTMRLQAALHWIRGRSAAAEDAWRRAAEFARKADDRRQLIEILGWLASATLWGPTPAPEGIRRCEVYLAEAGNHPSGQAVIFYHMAGLYAMRDEAATAQDKLGRAKELLNALGPTMPSVLTEPAAFAAMLAGDPVAAESHLRRQYESLTGMGEKEILATTAALLARAIMAQGRGRYDEAARLIATSRAAGAGEDPSVQIICQGLEARILAQDGRYAEAEELACSAAALAARTDLLNDHADAMLDLAHVLAAAGRTAAACAVAAQARDLYQSKGNLPGVRQSERISAYVAHRGSRDRTHE